MFLLLLNSFSSCVHYYIIYIGIDLGIGTKEAFLVQVLLLDEVTVDLDVVARMDLLEFFKEECEQVSIYDLNCRIFNITCAFKSLRFFLDSGL